jgi:hypothetical protein
VNIRTGKEEPYKEELPYAHYERLRKYIRQNVKSRKTTDESPPDIPEVSEEDIELLKRYFKDKENPAGYVRYLIKNNDHIDILKKLKYKKQLEQEQAETTTTYTPSWKDEDFEPATPEQVQACMDKLKEKLFKNKTEKRGNL